MNTAFDSLTHKMQRAALGKTVDLVLSHAEKDPAKTVGQIVDLSKQFYGDSFSEAEKFKIRHKYKIRFAVLLSIGICLYILSVTPFVVLKNEKLSIVLFFVMIFLLNSESAQIISRIIPMGQLRLISLQKVYSTNFCLFVDFLWNFILYFIAGSAFLHTDLK